MSIRLRSVIFVSLSLSYFSAFAEEWKVELVSGQVGYDYKEKDNDGLTNDGILNSETGMVPMTKFSIMRKSSLLSDDEEDDTKKTNWTPYARLDYQYASGDTDYNGYLQSGNSLTLYESITDNHMKRMSFSVGVQKKLLDNLSITPLIGFSHRSWRRELEQYQEDFKHSTISVGLNVDWQPFESQPFILESTAEVGKTVASRINVDDFGLNQSLGLAKTWKFGLEGQYHFKNNLSVNGGLSRQSWSYEETEVENGYQYPESDTVETVWHVGLGYGF